MSNNTRTVEDPTRRYYVQTPEGELVGPYTQRGAETVKNRKNLDATGPLTRCEVVRHDEAPAPAEPAAAAPAPADVVRNDATSPDGHCLCGCGAEVTREFRPGHDARYKSQLIRKAIAGDTEAADTLERRGWSKFLAKAQHAASNRAVKAERREAKQAERPGRQFATNADLLETMKAAKVVLLELGRYGRAAGVQRIDITAENCKAIADRTFDFDTAPEAEPRPPIYGMPGYEDTDVEVTRHIAPLKTKAERDAAKARRKQEQRNDPSTSSLAELLP